MQRLYSSSVLICVRKYLVAAPSSWSPFSLVYNSSSVFCSLKLSHTIWDLKKISSSLIVIPCAAIPFLRYNQFYFISNDVFIISFLTGTLSPLPLSIFRCNVHYYNCLSLYSISLVSIFPFFTQVCSFSYFSSFRLSLFFSKSFT